MPPTLLVFAPLDIVNAFGVNFSAAVDAHFVFQFSVRLNNNRAEFPSSVDFDFLENVHASFRRRVLSQIQHGVIVRPLKNLRKNLREMDTKLLSC